MTRPALLLLFGAALAAACPAPAWCATCAGSPLALELLARGESPDLRLAQRVIDREWATPADTAWQPALVGGVSEAGAMLLSAALPGAGQLYVGERSGYLFAVVEAAGWAGWWLLSRGADDDREEAANVAGVPDDSTSAWSFARWETATAGDAADLRRLYQLDREAFYDAINRDERFAAGWGDSRARSEFGDLRERSDQRIEDATRVETVLWVNHLVAAFDALRSARQHNLPLSRGLELKATGRWRSRGPQLALALQRRF